MIINTFILSIRIYFRNSILINYYKTKIKYIYKKKN